MVSRKLNAFDRSSTNYALVLFKSADTSQDQSQPRNTKQDTIGQPPFAQTSIGGLDRHTQRQSSQPSLTRELAVSTPLHSEDETIVSTSGASDGEPVAVPDHQVVVDVNIEDLFKFLQHHIGPDIRMICPYIGAPLPFIRLDSDSGISGKFEFSISMSELFLQYIQEKRAR